MEELGGSMIKFDAPNAMTCIYLIVERSLRITKSNQKIKI
jgi:hypothetical protein